MSNVNNGGTAVLSGVALVVAIIVLAAFGALAWFMITEVGADEVTWTRYAWLFASVEAIAFGAAGALFGSTIQRQQTERAEERAAANQDDAEKGRALATAIIADDPESDVGQRRLEVLGSGPAMDAAANVAASHAMLARDLFPPA